MARKPQNKYRLYDGMVIVAIFLMLLVHLSTNIVLWKQQDLTGADYDEIVKVHESNPAAKYILMSGNLRYIFSLLLMPAFIGAAYFVQRRRKDLVAVQFTAAFFLLLAIYNLNNDFGAVVGLYLQ